MSFFDKIKEGLEKKEEEIRKLRERYERYDDEHLFRTLKNSSGMTRLVVMQILKERGYGNQD